MFEFLTGGRVRVFLTGVAEWERLGFIDVLLGFKDSLFDLVGAFWPARGEVSGSAVDGRSCGAAVDSCMTADRCWRESSSLLSSKKWRIVHGGGCPVGRRAQGADVRQCSLALLAGSWVRE